VRFQFFLRVVRVVRGNVFCDEYKTHNIPNEKETQIVWSILWKNLDKTSQKSVRDESGHGRVNPSYMK
jgi:hypothetical protein